MILLRTTKLDPATLAFGDALHAASGLEVSVLVDERSRSAGECRFPKISLNAKTYAGLGLHLPGDVGWRCGDYGFYLARRLFPNVKHFWMIEDDVRITGNMKAFFEHFATASDWDLLTADLRAADRDWFWSSYAAASDVAPYRCFFPVVRLSSSAIDRLYAKRRAHSHRITRILLWPNDEAFVATTMANSELKTADFNDFGTIFYDRETFSSGIIDGDKPLISARTPQMLHRVLFGNRVPSVAAHCEPRPERTPLSVRLQRASLRRLNRLARW